MRRLVAILVLLLVIAGRPDAQDAAWWQSPKIQQAIHLSPRQITELEQLFHQDLALRIVRRQALRQLETEFAAAMNAGDVSRIESTRLVDRIERLRARINVRRTMMLIAMYRILSPDQRTALDTLRPRGRSARP